MSTTHKPDVLHRHPTNGAREVFAVVLAVPALALTVFVVYGMLDMATTTYIDTEVFAVQVFIGVAGLLAVLAWTGVVALHKSARRDLRSGPRRVMIIALLSMFVFLVLARLSALAGITAGLAAVQIAAYGLVVAAGATAFVAALRM
jgi:uncharacterized membrane protein